MGKILQPPAAPEFWRPRQVRDWIAGIVMRHGTGEYGGYVVLAPAIIGHHGAPPILRGESAIGQRPGMGALVNAPLGAPLFVRLSGEREVGKASPMKIYHVEVMDDAEWQRVIARLSAEEQRQFGVLFPRTGQEADRQRVIAQHSADDQEADDDLPF